MIDHDVKDIRNKFHSCENVHWIGAQRQNSGEWQIKSLRTVPNLTECAPKDNEYPIVLVDPIDNLIDDVPMFELVQSEFGYFKNVENWWTTEPALYYDGHQALIQP